MIPFNGEAELFKVQPTTSTMSPPCGEVKGNYLILRVTGADLEAQRVRAQLDRTIAEIEGDLSNLKKMCRPTPAD